MIEDINLLNGYLKRKYGKKIYKISLNGGMSCPNRDGKIGYGGCVFCSKGGSGEFAADGMLSIKSQIKNAKRLISKKMPKNQKYGYISYFQAYTNTYGDVSYLEKIYMEAIDDDEIVGLSIGTRPDCLGTDVLTVIKKINEIKPVMIELGFQTADEESAKRIKRGYENHIFDEAVKKLSDMGIEVVAHLIIGLPGEDKEIFLKTIDYINKLPVSGVKLQLLHILEDTELGKWYNEGMVSVLTLEQYTDILLDAIRQLRPDIVIHRMTGDGPKKLLVAPLWSSDKKFVLNTINKLIKERNIKQGEALK